MSFISQGSAATLISEWCEFTIFSCEISSAFCTPKIIKIGSFSPSYSKYKKGTFWDTVYIQLKARDNEYVRRLCFKCPLHRRCVCCEGRVTILQPKVPESTVGATTYLV